MHTIWAKQSCMAMTAAELMAVVEAASRSADLAHDEHTLLQEINSAVCFVTDDFLHTCLRLHGDKFA